MIKYFQHTVLMLFLLSAGIPALNAQEKIDDNAKRIEDLKRQLDELEFNVQKEEEADKAKQEPETELSEIKMLLLEVLEEQRLNKPQAAQSNNNNDKEVIIYINEIERMKQEMAAIRAEMDFMKREMSQLRRDVESSQRSGGGTIKLKGNSEQLFEDLNENIRNLSEDIKVIKEQNIITNEKLDDLSSKTNTVSVEPAEEVKEEVKPKVSANSNYFIVESTTESITNVKSMNREDLPSGYYIVIVSERNYLSVLKKQKELRNRGIETTIVQNKMKTWYHLYTKRAETVPEAGKMVGETRRSGFKDAWYISN